MQTKNTKQDRSIGVIPVHVQADCVRLFCLVRHAAGHWAFPKGHQNAGESDEATALRELREETGIDDITLDKCPLFTEQYFFEKDGVGYEKTVTYRIGYAHSTTGVTPDMFKTEISGILWLSYEDAKNQLTFPESKHLLEEVQEYFETTSSK